jgi:Zn-dependent metalloprotease
MQHPSMILSYLFSSKLRLFFLILGLLSMQTDMFGLNRKNDLALTIHKPDQHQIITEERQLEWIKEAYSLGKEYTLDLQKKFTDRLGFTHYRYEVFYKDVIIDHVIVTSHCKDKQVISASGWVPKQLALDVESKISSGAAFENIFILKSKSRVNKSENFSESVLQEMRPVIAFMDDEFLLAWKFDIKLDNPFERLLIYVDANDGAVLKELDIIQHNDVPATANTLYSGQRDITTDFTGSNYRLFESSRNIHTRNMQQGTDFDTAIEFTNTNTNWTVESDRAAYDVHWGLEATYDYFLTNFDRDSYDDNGSEINAFVHYDEDYANAFWSGEYLGFGDGNGISYGPLVSLEIVAHEYTHAITEFSAGLIYENESGALNESFSDIFGTVIDFIQNPNASYLIGDNISLTGSAMRNMSNPNLSGQPDTYNGLLWYEGNMDNGGVHYNSGVQNYWFYLLSEGGSGVNDLGNGFLVNPIGRDATAAICYRMLTVYLTPESQYADARIAAIQAAQDLYGTCSEELIQVTNAWYAVGVGEASPDAVVAYFSAEEPFLCGSYDVTFQNGSINGTSYVWDFGDNTTSTEFEPVHTYSAPGTYLVSLTVEGDGLCVDNDFSEFNSSIFITDGAPVATCIPEFILPSSDFGILNVTVGDFYHASGDALNLYEEYLCTEPIFLDLGSYNYIKVFTDGIHG